MIIRKIPLLAIVLLLSPSMTFAMDIDYYTYNGFQETVDAFNRVALIFANTNFQVLVGIGVFVSIGFGGLVFAYKNAAMGNFTAQPNFSWFFMPIVGFAFFKALTGSVGTVHVYDRVTNQYSPVGGVPVLITLIAYPVNMAERSMINIIDASSAYPYSSNAGGIIFDLLKSLSTETTFSGNTNISRSLRTFYKDCSPVAYANPGSYGNITIDQVRSQTPTDMMSTLAKMKSLSVSTVYYSDAVPAGETNTCAVAYDKIKADLDATALEPFRSTVCARIGLSTADAAQSMRCNSLISELSRIVFKNTSISSDIIFRNAFLSSQILEAMHEQDPEAAMIKLTSKNIMIEGFGTSTASGEWMPKIRASVFAMVLVIIPVIAMFIPTPFFGKALQLICVLLVWLAIWGVFDAAFLKIASDQAIAAMDEMVKHQQGVIAYLLAPESSMKALGLFGKARAMSIGLSSTICAIMFRMTTPFAQMAGNWSGTVDRAGTAAANQALDPTARAQATSGLLGAQAQSAEISNFGIEGMSAARQFTALQGTGSSLQTIGQLGNGGAAYAAEKVASSNAGATVGKIQGQGPDPSSIFATASNTSRVGAQADAGSAIGQQDAARKLDQSVSSMNREQMEGSRLTTGQSIRGAGGVDSQAANAERSAEVATANRVALERMGVGATPQGTAQAINSAIDTKATQRATEAGLIPALIDRAYQGKLEQASLGRAMNEIAEKSGMSLAEVYRSMANSEAGNRLAQSTSASEQADLFGKDLYDYMKLRAAASQGPVNLTPQEAQSALDSGRFPINDDQRQGIQDQIDKGRSTSWTAGLDSQGNVSYMQVGSRTSVENQQTASTVQSTSIATGVVQDSSDYRTTTPETIANLSRAMQAYNENGDDRALNAAALAMAASIKTITTQINTDDFSTRISGDASAGVGNRPQASKDIDITVPASRFGSLNLGIGGSGTDSSSTTTDLTVGKIQNDLKNSIITFTENGNTNYDAAARYAQDKFQNLYDEKIASAQDETRASTDPYEYLATKLPQPVSDSFIKGKAALGMLADEAENKIRSVGDGWFNSK